MDRQHTGAWGEKVVAHKLEEIGFQIIECNFYSRFGEIDIIAKEGRELVFVEVKTRSNKMYGEAVESITEYKLNRLAATAQLYMRGKGLEDEIFRIDVATLDKMDNGNWKFKLLRNALM